MKLKKIGISIFKRILYIVYLSIISLLLFEVIYRWQIVDFYKSSFSFLNPPSACDSTKKNVLIFGDSFTISPDSYVNILRDSLPHQNYINCALPGTGIIQTCFIAPKRIKNYPPVAIIYQIYVGNDLHDIRKNTFNGQLPFLKNSFYFLSNYFRSLSYINYELGQFAYFKEWKSKQGVQKSVLYSETPDSFSVKNYSPYEKQLLKGDPNLLENSILQKGDRKEDTQKLIAGITELIQATQQDSIPVYLFVIPHCTQVNAYYQNKYKLLGINLPPDTVLTRSNYPFIEKLTEHFSAYSQVKILNLLPYFQQTDSIGNRLFYENDFHLNAKGQGLCAKALLSSIKTLEI